MISAAFPLLIDLIDFSSSFIVTLGMLLFLTISVIISVMKACIKVTYGDVSKKEL